MTGDGTTTGNTGTATGGDAGLQAEPPEVAGPVFSLASITCTVSDSGSGTVDSGPTAPGYERPWECVNQNTGQTLAADIGPTGPIAPSAVIICTASYTATAAGNIPDGREVDSRRDPATVWSSGTIIDSTCSKTPVTATAAPASAAWV